MLCAAVAAAGGALAQTAKSPVVRPPASAPVIALAAPAPALALPGASPAALPLAGASAGARPDAMPRAVPGALPDGAERQVRQLVLDGTRFLLAPADARGAAPGEVRGDVRGGEWKQAAPGRATRVEVLIGALDPRLRLAPCLRTEAQAGVGTRWWGATRVGLRCVQGSAHWNVFVPVTVQVHGRALVAATALPAGSVLAVADLALAEVDLAADASAALSDGALAAGRTLQRALAAGESLRQSHLKPRQWFAAGDTVRVTANGDGFRVSGEAVALTRGVEGEAARVRTEGGRVLTGMPAAERRIDLPL